MLCMREVGAGGLGVGNTGGARAVDFKQKM
jgi:hypothetical protein